MVVSVQPIIIAQGSVWSPQTLPMTRIVRNS